MGILKKLLNGFLIVSGSLILAACDSKVEQKESKSLSHISVSLTKPGSKEVSQKFLKKQNDVKKLSKAKLPVAKVSAKKVSKGDTSATNIIIAKYKQSRGVSSALDSGEDLVVEEEKQSELIILDLSLNLDIEEKNHNLGNVNSEQFGGIFDFEEDPMNMEMEAHFEWPHNENNEQEMSPDGVGVGFSVGI